MGIFDRQTIKEEITETNVQTNIAETYGFQDVGGIAVGQAGGDIEVRIDQVDSGIVAASRDLGSGAIALAGDVTAGALRAQGDTARQVTRDAFDFGRDTGRDAFDFGGRALSGIGDAVRDALNFGGRSISAVEGLAGDSLAAQNRTIEYALQSNETVVGKALAATRSDAADILNTSVKYGVIAVGLIAALLLVPQFFKKAA